MKRASILQRSGESIANPAEYRQPTRESLDGRFPYHPDPEPDEPEISLAYGVKGVKKLLRVIGDASLSKKTRILALQQLRENVSSQEIQAEVIASKGVQILSLGIKREWEGEVVTRALAGEILAELALNMGGRAQFRFASTIPILVRALRQSEDKTVRIGASLALCSVSEFRDGLDLLESQQTLNKSLVAALSDGHTAVLGNMTKFFANATTHKAMVGPLLEADVTPALVSLLSIGKSPHRRQILVNTLTAIANLAHSPAGNAIAIELATAKEITAAVDSVAQFYWEDVSRTGAGALLALAGSEDGKKQIHAYAIPLLTRLVQVDLVQDGMAGEIGELSTKNNAASALRLATEYPAAMENALEELLPATQSIVFVFGAGVPSARPGTRLKALRVLTKWLRNPNADVRADVVRAVAALLLQEPEEATKDGLACLHLVRDLAVNSPEYGTELGRLSHAALLTLCQHSSTAVKQLVKAIESGIEVSDEVYEIVE